jgi:hypothetical protein
MRHSIAAGLIVASTVAAAAQTSSQQPNTTALQSAGKSVQVSGCLAAGPAANTFTLTTVEADLKPNPVGTSGVAGTPEGGAPKPEVKTVIYTLTAQPGVDLSVHIGQTVEVSGTKQTTSTTEQSRSTTSVTDIAGAHPPPRVLTTPKAEIVARRMNVNAVKMVAIDCHIQR